MKLKSITLPAIILLFPFINNVFNKPCRSLSKRDSSSLAKRLYPNLQSAIQRLGLMKHQALPDSARLTSKSSQNSHSTLRNYPRTESQHFAIFSTMLASKQKTICISKMAKTSLVSWMTMRRQNSKDFTFYAYKIY